MGEAINWVLYFQTLFFFMIVMMFINIVGESLIKAWRGDKDE